jgi:hypothetical protein
MKRSEVKHVIYLAVTIEEKEEGGSLPALGAVASITGDIMHDTTKHDVDMPWMVTGVTEVDIPGAGEMQ